MDEDKKGYYKYRTKLEDLRNVQAGGTKWFSRSKSPPSEFVDNEEKIINILLNNHNSDLNEEYENRVFNLLKYANSKKNPKELL